MRVRRTLVTVANLKHGSCGDQTLPSLRVRVGKNARTFIVVKDGIRNKFGRYPALTLARARQKAEEQICGQQARRRLSISVVGANRSNAVAPAWTPKRPMRPKARAQNL